MHFGESIGMGPVPRPRHLAFWDRYFERRRLAERETQRGGRATGG
jgi:hypothetical protein